MRSYIIALLASLSCLTQDVPKINFSSTHYDFGKIRGDKKVSHYFVVTNKGQAPLNITRLNSSCGCTSTVVGKWTLAPNEITNVEVILDPAGLCSTLKKSVQVVSNDPSHPITTLTFSAEVLREVMASTNTIFFDLTRTTTRKAYITLIPGSNCPVRVTKLACRGATYLSFMTYKEGNKVSLEVTIDGCKIPSTKRRGVDTVFIYTANAKLSPINIAVQWEVSV